jgi:hypothetical protein
MVRLHYFSIRSLLLHPRPHGIQEMKNRTFTRGIKHKTGPYYRMDANQLMPNKRSLKGHVRFWAASAPEASVPFSSLDVSVLYVLDVLGFVWDPFGIRFGSVLAGPCSTKSHPKPPNCTKVPILYRHVPETKDGELRTQPDC